MRIQCSSCGAVVTVRKNENGEVNCPHCGAGLLELQSTRDADIERYSDQPHDREKPKLPAPALAGSLLLIIVMGLVFLGGVYLVWMTIQNK